MMLKKLFLFLFLSFPMISCAGSQSLADETQKEISSENIDLTEHHVLKQKWFDSGKTSYLMEVSYNAFSPMKGIWKIEVLDDKLVRWEFRDRVNDESDKSFALMFLQENLFKIAEAAYQPKGLYLTSVLYDIKGYILEVINKANPESTEDRPTDRGFRIRVKSIIFETENP